ncbi:nuclear transport factor 2 family protein [Microbacterium sp. XT11]|uniref:nuclear transport factor 2 family protein n=1 Tax=Microbacterium sp. XT11 TaxID=367477 RepID=UPI000742D8E7|nr:nuclear transport factor 2 family protein [Microbacterium sp. XT11]ALX66859.1 SnoaL-like polyketide cyclase [Microbacterium sp. XT11]
MVRTTTEVIHDHLKRRLEGDLDGDLSNYHADVVLLTGSGVYRGHDGVRACAAELERLVGPAEFVFSQTLIDGDFGYLEWGAHDGDVKVCDGADSFVVRDGLIALQTVHYTPQKTD